MEECLAECAEVNHSAVVIQSLECRNRSAGITKLAIVVVLQHPCPHASREAQQLQSTCQRHRHTKRVLMRRSHGHKTGRRPRFSEPYVEAFKVYRDRDKPCARGLQSASRSRIRRVLNPHPVAWIEQNL